ncbi:hypothetical protein E7Z59_01155 [Robertkochia marina]|uniref:DUF4015 domain-containing protein n=1 Tax=Robertkochia marina TaxID=1227945 RepID=A0A4S3M295_9FLAO|nr:putative glycoside hydrolase [Robertkochia marina]THD68970.1 hypothetical protein E7Z59_01155 [Robertkochia marina]TRZ44790.1 hypothetical protein D3A96_07110 [Robertkochia marina]
MIKKALLLTISLWCLWACSENKKIAVNSMEDSGESFKFWAWMGASPEKPDSAYVSEFRKFSKSGIDAVLINTNTDTTLLSRLTPLAIKEGLEVHAWFMAMNRPGDSIALQHPEWYAVSREGNSCFDTRPYVDYYQWLCPSRKEAREHVLRLAENLARVQGITSVHLDYIRYSDIFLPVGLLPKYDLEQEEELPEFDFCYCDTCIEMFKEEHHKDVRALNNPAIDMEWKQFRLNRIKKVVDEAYDRVHAHGKKLTAAVFPYPEMADLMVRQRWDKWKIDMVLPMVYHNFYNEEIDWIGYATGQGVEDLRGNNTELHTGVFLPELTPDELRQAITEARDNGAKGVALFDAGALKPGHLEVLKAYDKNEQVKSRNH